ncbi:PsbP-related protein [Streptomyces sp. NPDC051453]|uniref:PsbP-related protein n=1 Tax=Streptomyces sp. NPDC051453 TaxID=3154941 RepID=UPI00342A4EFF
MQSASLVKDTTIMRRKFVLSVAAVALAAGAVAGCSSGSSSASGGGTANGSSPAPAPTESNPAGDIPDNQAYVAYKPAGAGFTVKVPEGWSRTTAVNTVTFTDKLNRIEIVSVKASAAPTTQSVNAKTVPVLRKQVPGFRMGKVTTVSRQGGRAVLVTYRGDSAPDSVTGKVVHDAFERYAYFKNGHEAVLTLSGPVGADNVDPWRIVSDSLRWQ